MIEPYFYHKNDGDVVWWVDFGQDPIGVPAVSFDRAEILYLFQDYPHAFTPEQKEIFDRENPYWAQFFADRPIKR